MFSFGFISFPAPSLFIIESDGLYDRLQFLWKNGGQRSRLHLIHSVWANFQTSTNNVSSNCSHETNKWFVCDENRKLYAVWDTGKVVFVVAVGKEGCSMVHVLLLNTNSLVLRIYIKYIVDS